MPRLDAAGACRAACAAAAAAATRNIAQDAPKLWTRPFCGCAPPARFKLTIASLPCLLAAMEATGGAWERCVPVAVRAGDKAERIEELTLRLTLSPAKLPHSGRVRLAARAAV